MKADDFMEAFQYLDDDLIESADRIRKHPQPVKRNWSKYLATAACFCLIFLSIQGLFGAKYDSATDSAAEDQAGNLKEDFMTDAGQSLALTIPDYSSWKVTDSNQNNFSYYSSERGQSEKETTTNDSAAAGIYEGLICIADVLGVYKNLEISSSYISVTEIDSFEKYMSQLTSFELYGHYPYIKAAEANSLLEKGAYISFHENKPESDVEYMVKLVYLYDKDSDLAIPYYHFYDETMDGTDDTSMIYKGWFVPAIEETYIANMPKH